jgi:hypothetical protein
MQIPVFLVSFRLVCSVLKSMKRHRLLSTAKSLFFRECSSVDNVVTSCAVGNGCSCSGCSVLSPTTPQSIHVSEGTFTGRVSLAIVFVAGIFVLI